MQENVWGELVYARIHAGPVFALARMQKFIFEESFPHICQVRYSSRCEYTLRLYSYPRENFLANYLWGKLLTYSWSFLAYS